MPRIRDELNDPFALEAIDEKLDVLARVQAGAGYLRDCLRTMAEQDLQDGLHSGGEMVLIIAWGKGSFEAAGGGADLGEESFQGVAEGDWRAGLYSCHSDNNLSYGQLIVNCELDGADGGGGGLCGNQSAVATKSPTCAVV